MSAWLTSEFLTVRSTLHLIPFQVENWTQQCGIHEIEAFAPQLEFQCGLLARKLSIPVQIFTVIQMHRKSALAQLEQALWTHIDTLSLPLTMQCAMSWFWAPADFRPNHMFMWHLDSTVEPVPDEMGLDLLSVLTEEESSLPVIMRQLCSKTI